MPDDTLEPPAQQRAAFTIDTLGDLDDGTVRLLIDAAIGEALADCDARPYLEKARRVEIRLELLPRPSEMGPGLKGVDADVKVKLSTPPRAGGSTFLPTDVHGANVTALMPAETAAPLFTKEHN